MFIETPDGPEGALLRFSLRNCYNEYSLLVNPGLSFESARVLKLGVPYHFLSILLFDEE